MPLDLAYATGSAVTVGTTEMSMATTGGTTTGVPQSKTDAGLFQFVIDGVANMAKGDQIQITIYEKARASGTQRIVFRAILYNAQSELFVTPPIALGIGWDGTLKKLAGTDRAVDWSIRRVS